MPDRIVVSGQSRLLTSTCRRTGQGDQPSRDRAPEGRVLLGRDRGPARHHPAGGTATMGPSAVTSRHPAPGPGGPALVERRVCPKTVPHTCHTARCPADVHGHLRALTRRWPAPLSAQVTSRARDRSSKLVMPVRSRSPALLVPVQVRGVVERRLEFRPQPHSRPCSPCLPGARSLLPASIAVIIRA